MGPRILFNSDGGSGALYAYEPPISPRQLCRVLNALEGTQVDVFIQCVSFGPFVAYGTEVGEVYGKGMTEFEDQNLRRLAHNIWGLLDAGQDPLEIWASRAHELGVQFWPSLRMNDIHKDWVERWPSLRTQWELEHPNLLIGRDVPDRYRMRCRRPGQPSDGFSWALDYMQQEVRDQRFALIEEICSKYDVDGFELDFLSHPYYFKKGQEQDGTDVMSQFLRRLRMRLSEIGEKKDRQLILLARVPRTVEMCGEIGFDVRTWIKEKLVDILAPATRGYLDMNADILSFVNLTRGSQCQIAGGLSDLYVRYYTGEGIGRGSIEMMRAAAQTYWYQRAGCIHLFNYDCHASGKGRIQHRTASPTDEEEIPLFSAEEFQILTEIGDPGKIARRNKHYYVTRDMGGHTPEAGGEMQLPASLSSSERRFQFIVGDDVEVACSSGKSPTICLRLTFDEHELAEHDVRVCLNGVLLGNARIQQGIFDFDDPPARQGENELTVSLHGLSNEAQGPVRLEGIELFVDYEAA